jgi:hypothetical protein
MSAADCCITTMLHPLLVCAGVPPVEEYLTHIFLAKISGKLLSSK